MEDLACQRLRSEERMHHAGHASDGRHRVDSVHAARENEYIALTRGSAYSSPLP
jgi:hypothetical protein